MTEHRSIDDILDDIYTLQPGGRAKAKAELLTQLESVMPELEDTSLWESYPEKDRRKFHRYIKATTRNQALQDCLTALRSYLR